MFNKTSQANVTMATRVTIAMSTADRVMMSHVGCRRQPNAAAVFPASEPSQLLACNTESNSDILSHSAFTFYSFCAFDRHEYGKGTLDIAPLRK